MLEERSVLEAGNTSTRSIQNFENESMLDTTDRSTSIGFQIPKKVEIARDSTASSGKLECLDILVCNSLPKFYMNGSDVGQNSIISNILSLNFDSDDSVLNSPHNLANLLLIETDKCNGLSKKYQVHGSLRIASSQDFYSQCQKVL